MADRTRNIAERVTAEIAQAVVDGIDVDAIVRRIDVEALAARVDPDAIVERLDVNALLDRIDVDRLVDRIDLDTIVDRIDLDGIIDRIDLDAIVARVDLAALGGQSGPREGDAPITSDAVLGLIDLQGVIDRIDLGPALRRAGLAEIVAGSVGSTALNRLRSQVLQLDVVLQRGLATLLRQELDTWPAGPSGLVGDAHGPLDLDAAAGDEPHEITGHFAGPFSRFLVAGLDVAGSVFSFSVISTSAIGLLQDVFGLVEGGSGGSATRGAAWVTGLVLFLGLWFLVPLLVTGRTPAMGLVGLRVVGKDGEPLPPLRTIARTLLQGVSVFFLVGLGYLPVLFDQQRGAMHDLLVGSVVVHDWGGDDSQVRTPVRRFIESREI